MFYDLFEFLFEFLNQRNLGWRSSEEFSPKRNILNDNGRKVAVIAVVVDAMPLDLSGTQYADIPVYYFPKGETKSSSIAAASIVAKVTRDSMMELYDLAIPGYKWSDNKGYGRGVECGSKKKVYLNSW